MSDTITNTKNKRLCKDCKWYEGLTIGISIGTCNDYPCNNCRVDKWEEKDEVDE